MPVLSKNEFLYTGHTRAVPCAVEPHCLAGSFFTINGLITFVCMEVKHIAINAQEVEKLERIAFILKTVAHPLRLGIVHLLEQYPRLSVTEICDMLGSEQSLTSHHLQTMRLKGILGVKREGRSMLYSLKERDVSLIIECLENCQCNM